MVKNLSVVYLVHVRMYKITASRSSKHSCLYFELNSIRIDVYEWVKRAQNFTFVLVRRIYIYVSSLVAFITRYAKIYENISTFRFDFYARLHSGL